MMNESNGLDIVKEVAKEVAKDAYTDAGKPIAKSTGELIGLVPRAIKAALSPLEKWILHREYNVAETAKLLEEKLQNTPPELIEAPEPHISVPVMQYISYCMDNEELRDLYANLFANSMNKVVKNGVHPGFVEIIKQLSPDEAKILRYLHNNYLVPIIGLKIIKTTGGYLDILKLFTNICELCECENISDYEKYIDNLKRLGLVTIPADEMLTDKSKYEALKTHPFIVKQKAHYEELDSVEKVEFMEGHIQLTSFGNSFCSICIESPNRIVEVIKEN